jgi:hypothetical protein
MPHVSVQFAPLERAQIAPTYGRKSVQFSEREARQDMQGDSFAAPARNMGITWKVILLLWLLFLATLCVRAIVPAAVRTPVSPSPTISSNGSTTTDAGAALVASH